MTRLGHQLVVMLLLLLLASSELVKTQPASTTPATSKKRSNHSPFVDVDSNISDHANKSSYWIVIWITAAVLVVLVLLPILWRCTRRPGPVVVSTIKSPGCQVPGPGGCLKSRISLRAQEADLDPYLRDHGHEPGAPVATDALTGTKQYSLPASETLCNGTTGEIWHLPSGLLFRPDPNFFRSRGQLYWRTSESPYRNIYEPYQCDYVYDPNTNVVFERCLAVRSLSPASPSGRQTSRQCIPRVQARLWPSTVVAEYSALIGKWPRSGIASMDEPQFGTEPASVATPGTVPGYRARVLVE